MNYHRNDPRNRERWQAFGGVVATLTALAAAFFFMQPVGAARSGCENASVSVFTDSLEESWSPASWSGATTKSSSGAIEVHFAEQSSAFSIQTESANIENCQFLVFDIASDVNDPKLQVRLNNVSGANAGSLSVNDAAYLDGAAITAQMAQVRLPLTNFVLTDDKVSRISVINTGEASDITLSIDNIRFEGSSPVAEVEDSPDDQPDELVVQPHAQREPDRELVDQASDEVCATVYDENLKTPWQPASWSVEDIDYGAVSESNGSALSATFPQQWGAISALSTTPLDVADCDELLITMSSSADTASFAIELSGGDRTVDGTKSISVTPSPTTFRVPLAEFNLTGQTLSRVSLLNQGPESEFTAMVYRIALAKNDQAEVAEPQVEPQEAQAEVAEPQTEVAEPQAEPQEAPAEVAEPQAEVAEPPAEPQEAQADVAEPSDSADGAKPSTTPSNRDNNRIGDSENLIDSSPEVGAGATQNGSISGDKFRTMAPKTALPTGSQCAARVRPTPETVPENTSWNQRVGRSVAGETYISDQLYYVDGPAAFESRIDGNYTGTTDEIIQWAACKWGFDEDLIRAQVYTESSWFAGRLGDCGDGPTLARTGGKDGCDSNGLLQVRGSDVLSNGNATHMGTFPMAWDSSAFNLDYALAVQRICFEGQEVWLADTAASGTTYEPGDLYGCLGRWYSGEWRVPAALGYINNVKRNLTSRSWEDPSGRGCPEWTTNFYCSGVDRNIDGSRR